MRMRIDGKKRNADMLVEVEKEMDSSSFKIKE
jgi:hypothetical protein